MNPLLFTIDPELRRAQTPPGLFYTHPWFYEQLRERVFATSWQCLVDAAPLTETGMLEPHTLLPMLLEEPLLQTFDGTQQRLLSNVCTHRANVLVKKPCKAPAIRCNYHGRKFALDGSFRSMPEFDGVENFPSPSDALPRLPFEQLGPLLFTQVRPGISFHEWSQPIQDYTAWLPWNELRLSEEEQRDYEFNAHWALYCENYLEGFHIPFVHPSLNAAVQFDTYRTLLFPWGVLQLASPTNDDEIAFVPPEGTIEAGTRLSAYYFWLFPNTMLNLYPWGLSLNVVEPRGLERTRVRFRSYVWNEALRSQGAGAALDTVELEDEAIVEQVQQGIRSRTYQRGRYSPSREQGVHHFHRLLLQALEASVTR